MTMSTENSGQNGHRPESVPNPALYSPSLPAGNPPWHQGAAPQAGPAGVLQGGSAVSSNAQPNGTFPSQGAFLTMMAMMQHMQQNASSQVPLPYPQQPKVPSEMQNISIPQASDDNTLAQVLFEQTARGYSYKTALESLHGHRNIAAYAWKDYYLENKQRIDDIITAIRTRNLPTPSIKSERESSTSVLNGDDQHIRKKARKSETPARSESSVVKPKNKPRASSSTSVTKSRATKTKTETSVGADCASSSSRRRTLNSLASTPGAGFLQTVPPGVAIDPDTGLPAAPSRSPSPPQADPSNMIARGKQRFTEADARFLYKRIAYDLARNSDLTKNDLIEILAQKAPHHTVSSWRTYWTRHEDVADKMVLLTELDDEDRAEVLRSWKTGESVTASGHSTSHKFKAPNYAESSESDLESSKGSNGEESDDQEYSQDGEESIGSTEEDEVLGEAGSMFTKAEMRVLAKHIATKPDWLKEDIRDWGSFFSSYPQRTAASWREYYRRKSKEINNLARKYVKRAREREEAVMRQRGRPSWARKGSISDGKRRHEGSDEQENT